MNIKKIFIIVLLFTKISHGMDLDRLGKKVLQDRYDYESHKKCLSAIERNDVGELDSILKNNPDFDKKYIAEEFTSDNPDDKGKPTNLLAIALFIGEGPCIRRIIQSHSQYQTGRYNKYLKEGKNEQDIIAILKNENRPAYLHIFLRERACDFVDDNQSQDLFDITQSLIDSKLAFADDIVDSPYSSTQYVSFNHYGTSILHINDIPINIIEYLLVNGAKSRINFRDKDNLTPMQRAAPLQSNSANIKILIDYGADPQRALIDALVGSSWNNAIMLLDKWPTSIPLPKTFLEVPGYYYRNDEVSKDANLFLSKYFANKSGNIKIDHPAKK